MPLPETWESDLVRLMVGREITDFYGKREIATGEGSPQAEFDRSEATEQAIAHVAVAGAQKPEQPTRLAGTRQ